MAADIERWNAAGLQYSVEDSVAWLRMNRPERRNAIHIPLRTALLQAIHEVSEDPDVRAAVITGNGVAFSSGADLAQEGGAGELPKERWRSIETARRDDSMLYAWNRLMNAIWNSDKVFISAVNGIAAGGGCQLALACDFIVASEEASFWEVFVHRGFPLEGGGAWILPKLTSLVRAKEIAILGEPLTAAEALQFGMINRCVSADALESTARDIAARVAKGPTIRIGHIKSQLNASYEQTKDQSFRDEANYMGLHGGSDATEAITAYIERRPPNFTGR
ncbi:MAG: enoyl-CoA hydratase/isomerase family protein [Acidimicrobiia bacterium]